MKHLQKLNPPKFSPVFIPAQTSLNVQTIALISHEHLDYSDFDKLTVIEPKFNRQAFGAPGACGVIQTDKLFATGNSFSHLANHVGKALHAGGITNVCFSADGPVMPGLPVREQVTNMLHVSSRHLDDASIACLKRSAKDTLNPILAAGFEDYFLHIADPKELLDDPDYEPLSMPILYILAYAADAGYSYVRISPYGGILHALPLLS